MRGNRTAWTAGVLAALLALGGCGNSDPMGEVSGIVRRDGNPLPSGTITFFPVDGKTATAGAEIKNGYYAAKVPVGTMKVVISAEKVVGTKKLYPTANSPAMPIAVELLPGRYNEHSELTLDVQPGKNPKDYDLKSK